MIESPFVLQPDGNRYELDSEIRVELGPLLLDLYPASSTSGSVDDVATFRLEFTGGSSITISHYQRYEAWQINGPGRRLVVCIPADSGDLAVWS